MKTHVLGYPRIGEKRQLKFALEAYWSGRTPIADVASVGKSIRESGWEAQIAAGLSFITAGDFSLYDHVLDHAVMFNILPRRVRTLTAEDHDKYFLMARGSAPSGDAVPASEMTKWFDTNYHFIVPELETDTKIQLNADGYLEQIKEALAFCRERARAGVEVPDVKAVLVGPLTLLWLAKNDAGDVCNLSHLPSLLSCYSTLLRSLTELGVAVVQIDEPVLAYEFDGKWQRAFADSYQQLSREADILLTTYFAGVQHQHWVFELPVFGFHIDCVRSLSQLGLVSDMLPDGAVLSLGVIDGRNIWAADLDTWRQRLTPSYERLGERLWLGSSCSLLHAPYDVSTESKIDPEIKRWLAFAKQKLNELSTLASALCSDEAGLQAAAMSREVTLARRESVFVTDAAVAQRTLALEPAMFERMNKFSERRRIQRMVNPLPPFPTTTIGSFPQTPEIRQQRKRFRSGEITRREYDEFLRREIELVIRKQEALGLDVLVHGEPERNDMVEFFAQYLDGVTPTEHGWVQSFGSRCVKPPIIYGDVSRKAPMTVDWSRYAQSLTKQPVKGMLTGPVTMLQWSFVRDDQPRRQTCLQMALAIRDEVSDLERAGIGVIQVDEPALREGLPLRFSDRQSYLDYAVDAFRLTVSGVTDQTQIHTHMCYSEFADILDSIIRLDADVITIEASRSGASSLDMFAQRAYLNDIGPGVFDIHSPRIPEPEEIVGMVEECLSYIDQRNVWINPDCGLKTRHWSEVDAALTNMVEAARTMRSTLAVTA